MVILVHQVQCQIFPNINILFHGFLLYIRHDRYVFSFYWLEKQAKINIELFKWMGHLWGRKKDHFEWRCGVTPTFWSPGDLFCWEPYLSTSINVCMLHWIGLAFSFLVSVSCLIFLLCSVWASLWIRSSLMRTRCLL